MDTQPQTILSMLRLDIEALLKEREFLKLELRKAQELIGKYEREAEARRRQPID